MAKIAVTPAIVLAEFIVLGKRILFQKAQLQVLQAEESLPRQLIACLIQLKAKDDLPSNAGSGKSWCEVYTLGTGMWRILGQVPFLVSTRDRRNRVSSYESDYTSWYGSHDGVFVSSNLHWLVYDLNTNQERVCTFDLKKEEFQLTAPPRVTKKVDYRRMGMLGECLCVCDNTRESGFTIWVLKDYGNKQSRSKELFIDQSSNQLYGPVHPLKLFKDGTVLFSLHSYQLIYHSADKTFETFNMCWNDHFNKPLAMVFVPGFISSRVSCQRRLRFLIIRFLMINVFQHVKTRFHPAAQ